jgi:hypothetical protein
MSQIIILSDQTGLIIYFYQNNIILILKKIMLIWLSLTTLVRLQINLLYQICFIRLISILFKLKS